MGPNEGKQGILDLLDKEGVERTLELLHEPIGCIFTISDPYDERAKKIGEFGMLIATLEYTGKGLGRGLVKKAEERARSAGCLVMRTRLVIPKDWEHPVKKRLGDWYERMNYVKGTPQDFKLINPHITFNQPACPLNIIEFTKTLDYDMIVDDDYDPYDVP